MLDIDDIFFDVAGALIIGFDKERIKEELGI